MTLEAYTDDELEAELQRRKVRRDQIVERAEDVVPVLSAVRIALGRFAAERGILVEEATAEALRDWLTGHGYLKLPAEDEATKRET